MYWLFKYFMKKLIKDFKESYETNYMVTGDNTMRPDLYQLERYLDNRYEWVKKAII